MKAKKNLNLWPSKRAGKQYNARVAELVDALDSKSSVRKDVRVRVPPLVLKSVSLSVSWSVNRSVGSYNLSVNRSVGSYSVSLSVGEGVWRVGKMAEVVELVDTHVSGACVRKDMGFESPLRH